MSQWRLFESWCRKRDVDPLKATSVLVCEFLMYLFNDRKLQAKSIAGYKSALSFFLKRASGYDLSTCTVVADLLRSFYRERPPPPRVVVKWDIPTVLRFLQSAAFNPDVITPRLLTLKAIFLFALASGRRRSELHALERESVSFASDMSAVTVRPHLRFLSKTHLATQGIGALHEIIVPALPDAPDTPYSLCPVRVLKHYIDTSDTYRSPGQNRLFVSYRKSFERDITAQTVSRYVKTAICEAHSAAEVDSDTDVASKYDVKAHQVRHIAHSLSQLGSMPLTDIIRTGSWKTPNTFIKHYIQQLPSASVSELQQLGSFVAMESVFQHKEPVGF